MIRLFSVFSLIVLMLTPTLEAHGRRGGWSSYMMTDRRASAGLCVADVNSTTDANRILARNNVRVGKGTNTKQLISVAKGIQQIELLAGGQSKYISGSSITFPRRQWNSRYAGGGVVQMGRNHRDGNVAHVMHELGHHVGSAGNLYGAYRSEVATCRHTDYCRARWRGQGPRQEEFAEAFSAFVTHPEMLKNSKQAGCRQAYAFFAKRFPQAGKYAVCNKHMLNTAASSLGRAVDGPRTRVASLSTSERSEGGYR